MMNSNYSKLDLAFVLDTTGSMGSYIQHAKDNINKIADELRRSEKCELRVGIVNYRDHPPQDRTYITKIHELTDDIEKTKTFIKNTKPAGGGDFPEAICCGLNDCLMKLKWQNDAVKVVILICDAPPHGLGLPGDGLPKGCPKKCDPVEIAHEMATQGITLYTAGCEPSLGPFRQFFIALSLITGGQYVPLEDSNKLTDVIVGGAREDISMEKLMAQVHNEYMMEMAEKGTRVDEDELTKRIHKVLNSKSETKINTIKMSASKTLKISENTKSLSKQKNLKEFVSFAKDNKIELQNYSWNAIVVEDDSAGDHGDGDAAVATVVVGDEGGGDKGIFSKKRGRGRPAVTIKKLKTSKEEDSAVSKVVGGVEEATKEDAADDNAEAINIDQARRLVKKAIARNSK